jgi:hypothetical protein
VTYASVQQAVSGSAPFATSQTATFTYLDANITHFVAVLTFWGGGGYPPLPEIAFSDTSGNTWTVLTETALEWEIDGVIGYQVTAVCLPGYQASGVVTAPSFSGAWTVTATANTDGGVSGNFSLYNGLQLSVAAFSGAVATDVVLITAVHALATPVSVTVSDLAQPGMAFTASVANNSVLTPDTWAYSSPVAVTWDNVYNLIAQQSPNLLAGFLPVASDGTYSAAPTRTVSADPDGLLCGSSIIVIGTPAPAITTTSLPLALIDSSYSETLDATGVNLTWAVTSGSLPTGLTLSNSGVLSGTPSEAGSSTFTVTVTEPGPYTASATLTLTVNPALSVSASLHVAIAGISYDGQVGIVGGVPPYTVTLESGTLPSGLSFSDGLISGIASQADVTEIGVQVEDSVGNTVTQTVSLGVGLASPSSPFGNQLGFTVQQLQTVYTGEYEPLVEFNGTNQWFEPTPGQPVTS